MLFSPACRERLTVPWTVTQDTEKTVVFYYSNVKEGGLTAPFLGGIAGQNVIMLHYRDILPRQCRRTRSGGDAATAKIIRQTENCYSCHRDHGAVDTTFVQFYPTVLPIAKGKGTLAAAYQKESESH